MSRENHHRLITKQLQNRIKELHELERALIGGEQLLRELNLLPILDYAITFSAMQDWNHDPNTGENVFVNRYHLTIIIPLKDKPIVRPYLLRALDHNRFPAWDKDFRVIRSYVPTGADLHEVWSATFERLETADNRIGIHFTRSAVEGEKLSDTCRVERVHVERKPEEYLALTCKKD